MKPTLRNRLEGTLFRTLMGLPPRAKRLLGGRPTSLDGLTLDPETQLALKLMNLQPEPDLATLSPAAARNTTGRLAASVAPAPLPMRVVEDRTLAGAAGRLPARLYVPFGAPTPSPLLVYYHGGGWVECDLETHDGVCRFLAQEAGIRVLAVDYRLAPEHPFPACVDDATAAFRDAVARAAELGVDPTRIAVGGDSAGGHLSTVVCLDGVRDGGPTPAYQLLIYPVTDVSKKTRSYELFADGFFLTAGKMDWYIGHLLASPEDALDPRASPLLAEDLSGLPPAYVATAGFDVLRDEGEAYARRLQEAGVQVTLRRFEGLIHAFANSTGSAVIAAAAMREIARALASALQREGTSRG